MARGKAKRKRHKSYCTCPGVNPANGKVLKGFRANKRGGCPIPTKKMKAAIAKFIGPKVPKGLRKAHKAHAKVKGYTGSGYAEGYAAHRRALLNQELIKAGVTPLSGSKGYRKRKR